VHDTCFDCHGDNPVTAHHANPNAAVGNCEYCHEDPRGFSVGWNAAAPGDNGNNYGTNLPTQMACRECHVIFSGGNMIIKKFTRSDYSKYTVDYTKQNAHVIPISVNRINNYGICFGCHNGISAPLVTVWHARPDKHSSQWVMGQDDAERCTGYREVWDDYWPPPANLAKYTPGRSSGTIGRFNLFDVPGFGYIPGPWDYDACSDAGQYQSSVLNFTRIAIPAVTGNGNTSGSVPVFPSLTPLVPSS
jgi:hypothetical protein